MKVLLLLAFACAAEAQTTIVFPRVFGLVKTRVFRGWPVILRSLPYTYAAYPVSQIDTSADVVSGSNPFLTTDNLKFLTTGGTIPEGTTVMLDYRRCVATDPFHMRTQWGQCSNRVDFVTQGTQVWLGKYAGSTQQVVNVITLPPGFALRRPPRTDVGGQLAWNPTYSGWVTQLNTNFNWNMDLDVASTAPVGSTNITVTVRKLGAGLGYDDGQVVRTIEIPVTVQDLVPVALSPPSSFPPLNPMVAAKLKTKWAQQWDESPASRKICDADGNIVYANTAYASPNALTVSDEQKAWYYQGHVWMEAGARVAANPDLLKCAITVASWYRDRLLAGASFETYHRFTTGLWRMGPHLRGNYRAAILYNGTQLSPLVSYNNYMRPGGANIRDNAYAVINTINMARACGMNTFTQARALTTQCGVSNWQRYMDFLSDRISLLGQLLDEQSEQSIPGGQQYQTWMSGLVAQALMEWYEFSAHTWNGPTGGLSRDPRPLRYLKDWVDHYRLHLYIPPAGSQKAREPRCITPNRTICEVNEGVSDNLLISLTIGPAAAFLFFYTGDAAYRQLADEVLDSAVSLILDNNSSKIKSQNGGAVTFMLGYRLGFGAVLPHWFSL